MSRLPNSCRHADTPGPIRQALIAILFAACLCPISLLQTALAQQSLPSGAPFRFVHITDTHLTASGNIEPLKQLVTEIQSLKPLPAFVVDTGDVTEAGKPEEFARFAEGTTGLSIPFYCTPGNHDVRWGPLGKEAFTDSFQKLYRSFDYGGCHFILLDSTVLLEHWGHFDAAELKWLESDLKKQKKETPLFLFFHHWIGRDKRMVDNEEALFRLLSPYNVAAILVGHGHADIEWKINGIQCVMARGLYQGSYNLIDVGTNEVRILRVRKEDKGKDPIVVATIPKDGGSLRRVSFAWDDPNIPPLARRRFMAGLWEDGRIVRDERVKAEYRLDTGEFKPMAADNRDLPPSHEAREERDLRNALRGRYITQFETKGLTAGSHLLTVRLIASDGSVFQREEAFIYEPVSGLPKQTWDEPYLTGDTIQSSPALSGDTLFVTSFDGKLYALNVANGKRRWSAPTKGSLFATPLVTEDSVYVGSMDHGLYSFDKKTGRQNWRFDAGTPLFSTPAVSNGIVCFGANRKIFGIDVATGHEKWTQDAGSFFQSRAATADGVFYLGGWDNTLYALDAGTGQPRWKLPMGRSNSGRGTLSFYYSPAITSPTIAEGRVFICTNDGLLHAVNIKTGQDDWAVHAPQGGDTFGYSSPLYSNGRIYLGGLGPRGDCYALDARTGDLVWQCATGAENYDSSPVIADNLIVIGSVQGRLFWIDSMKGTVVHQYTLEPGYTFSSPATAGKTVFMTSMNRAVTAITIP